MVVGVVCAAALAAAAVPLAGASTAQAASKPSPFAIISHRVSSTSMPESRARILAYWTKSRMAHAKFIGQATVHGSAGSAPVGGLHAGGQVTHKIAPVAGVAKPRKVAGRSAGTSADTIFVSPAIGKVFFTNNGVGYACSGSSVNSDSGDLVLTAGHCVYNNSSHTWSTNFVFIPGYDDDGSAPYGEWTAGVLTTFAGFTQGDLTLDTGFASVSGPGLLRNKVGAMGLLTGYSSVDNPLLVMGYPSFSPYNQYFCEADGTLGSDGFLHMPCGLTPGSSGSPILEGYDNSNGLGTAVSVMTEIVTVTSGGSTSTSNEGPIFTANTWGLYQSIQGVAP
jgi:V8-like Glu-specific endopeptidase